MLAPPTPTPSRLQTSCLPETRSPDMVEEAGTSQDLQGFLGHTVLGDTTSSKHWPCRPMETTGKSVSWKVLYSLCHRKKEGNGGGGGGGGPRCLASRGAEEMSGICLTFIDTIFKDKSGPAEVSPVQ